MSRLTSPFTCAGCGKVFDPNTIQFSQHEFGVHYKKCHLLEIERQEDARRQSEEDYDTQCQLDKLCDSGLSVEQADAIIEVIKFYR